MHIARSCRPYLHHCVEAKSTRIIRMCHKLLKWHSWRLVDSNVFFSDTQGKPTWIYIFIYRRSFLQNHVRASLYGTAHQNAKFEVSADLRILNKIEFL